MALIKVHLLRIRSYEVGNTYRIIQAGSSPYKLLLQGKDILAKGESILPKATKLNMGTQLRFGNYQIE